MSHSYTDICSKCKIEVYSIGSHVCPLPYKKALKNVLNALAKFIDDRDGVFLTALERELNEAYSDLLYSESVVKSESESK